MLIRRSVLVSLLSLPVHSDAVLDDQSSDGDQRQHWKIMDALKKLEVGKFQIPNQNINIQQFLCGWNKTKWINLCCSDKNCFCKIFNYPNWFPCIQRLRPYLKWKFTLNQENFSLKRINMKLNPINVNCLACGGWRTFVLFESWDWFCSSPLSRPCPPDPTTQMSEVLRDTQTG